MRNGRNRAAAFMLSIGVAFSWAGSPIAAQENDKVGTLAFAQCDEYINIRSGADEDSEIVGKMYNDCAATIVGQEGDWYQITSGNAAGYVKAEYFATGEAAEQIADRTAYHVAKVHPEWLNVRTAPDEAADVAEVAQNAQELEVVDWNGGDWMKVALAQDSYGYVNAYYVDYHTYYAVGETLAEEQHRLDRTQTEKNAQAEYSQPEAAEDTKKQTELDTEQTEYMPEPEYTEQTEYAPESEYTQETEYVQETEYAPEPEYTEETEYVPESEYTEETEYVPETEYAEETEGSASSGLGQQIVDYALQFVGNPYVYGGNSLTNGVDCSGFTQQVFANFGIGLSRTAQDQSYGGYAVDMGSLQPGDLIFYGGSGYIGHVALYIGNGQIVHASTEETGIIISNYNYNTPVCARRYL